MMTSRASPASTRAVWTDLHARPRSARLRSVRRRKRNSSAHSCSFVSICISKLKKRFAAPGLGGVRGLISAA